MTISVSLLQLGWAPFFQQQLSLEEWEYCNAGRVAGHHRSNIDVLTEGGRQTLFLTPETPPLTVGDWVLLDHAGRLHRVLERLSLFSRKAAGGKVARQLIAANIDTVFVVSSLNEDFNLNRIERYLTLAADSGVDPVVILTKADLCDDPDSFLRQVRALQPLLTVEAVNARDPRSIEALRACCAPGKTVALLGSSGVGKSTLVNTLLGRADQAIGAIREDDGKGRHTTTARSLHFVADGGILLDTPGMRELQIADCEQGVQEVFSDIRDLAMQCRFSDCGHGDEPGCAVRTAIQAGTLDQRRLASYRKLMREQALNQSTLAEKRARDRPRGRYYRAVLAETTRRKKG